MLHPSGSHGRSLGRVGLMVLGTGCFSPQQLPARSQPARELPQIAIEPAPPPAGTGRVVLDSVDGPATVEEVVGETSGYAHGYDAFAYASATSTKPICTTPCVVDLLPGNHQLIFHTVGEKTSYVATVVAGARPSVYRLAPTRTTGPTGRVLVGGLDGLALAALMLAPTLLVVSAIPSATKEGRSDEVRSAGTALAVGGGILLGIGIAIDFAGRGTITPGSAIQWEPHEGTTYRKIE
jgi:hypothetical protein